MPTTTPDVIVVGGGIIGVSCARALAHLGAQVLVVDAGDREGAATPAAAGMLAPLAEARAEDPLLALNIRARDLYVKLVAELEEETGIDIGHWTGGILHAVFSEEGEAAAKSRVAWHRQSGFHSDWLPQEDIRERYPGLSQRIVGGVLAGEDGLVEPMALYEAFLKSAELRGARIQEDSPVTRVRLEHGKFVAVEVNGSTIGGDAVLIAAGCWSGRIEGLPRPLSVEPVRGQMAALPWPTEEPRSIVYGDRGYVVNKGNEGLVGSTMEFAGFDASNTDEGFNRIMKSAVQLYPALAGQDSIRRWAGLRPATPDGNPIIGRDPEVENLWYATGHGRNGILLAGLSGELIASLYEGKEVDSDLSALDPGRFWSF